MIVTFSVSNFRSFDKEQTLSLVASKRLAQSHPEHTVDIPGTDERLLRAAVIYGANGAGKSNLFVALRYLRSLALETRSKSTSLGRIPFGLGGKIRPESTFDLQFVSRNQLYRYGLRVDDHRVLEEWLSVVNKGKDAKIFSRATSTSNEVKVSLGPKVKADAKFKALATVGGPPNQSFLATAYANLGARGLPKDFLSVFRWFINLSTIAPNDKPLPVGHLLSEDNKFLDFAGDFLKAASTGVERLEVVKDEISEDELRQYFPDDVVREVLTQNADDEKSSLTILGDGKKEFLIDRGKNKRLYRLEVKAVHKNQLGKDSVLALSEESDGTRRLLDIIPTLDTSDHEAIVYFIDEVDRSLHPILVREYLKAFFKSCADSHRQVILTTHDATLLDLDLLRRDEIWFVEKDKGNSTKLYSLNDFKIRNDLGIEKHYLQGRFGAIPFVGDIMGIISQETEAVN